MMERMEEGEALRGLTMYIEGRTRSWQASGEARCECAFGELTWQNQSRDDCIAQPAQSRTEAEGCASIGAGAGPNNEAA